MFKPDDELLYRGERLRVQFADDDNLLFIVLSTGRSKIFSVSKFSQDLAEGRVVLCDAGEPAPSGTADLGQFTDEKDREIIRYKLPYAQHFSRKRVSIAEAQAAVDLIATTHDHAVKPSVGGVRRWRTFYVNSGHNPASLLDRRRTKPQSWAGLRTSPADTSADDDFTSA